MRIVIFIIFLFMSCSVYGQSLFVSNLDDSAYPVMNINFFAFDATDKLITNLIPSDFSVTEFGLKRNVTNVSCPDPKPAQSISLTFGFDVSHSMNFNAFDDLIIEFVKNTARNITNKIVQPRTEIALVTCNSKSLIIQDFTTNKSKLLSAIDPIVASGGDDFVEHLLNQREGLLNIAKKGKNQRIAILFTDGWAGEMSMVDLLRCVDTCSKYNIKFYAVVYASSGTEVKGIQKSLQLLADATGGYLYEDVISKKESSNIANLLAYQIQGGEACKLEWRSDIICTPCNINIEIKLTALNLIKKPFYRANPDYLAYMTFTPKSISFTNITPGIKNQTSIQATAHNADFNVTNISCSNPAYTINPKSFFLKSGQSSPDITITYLPVDSSYTSTYYTFESDICPQKYFASGSSHGKKANIKTINIIQPNGGEVFAVGTDTTITWEGILPGEKVILEYSIDNGTNWSTITNNTKGLSYNWRVPNTPSDKCLARVTAKSTLSGCGVGDVQICDQIWMGCNLDVDHYRNGDPIPEVKGQWDWDSLKTGAWCHYNYNSANGIIYGKLYNWYAVNDPRGLAPVGWHIPSQEEWAELFNCLGGEHEAPKKMISMETDENGEPYWINGLFGVTNESGFSALPAGYRGKEARSGGLGNEAFWWTSSGKENPNAFASTVYLSYNFLYVGSVTFKKWGCSVRCVKD